MSAFVRALSEEAFAAMTGGATLLVPSNELAAALFDACERAHRAAGHTLWPTPRVRELGGWLAERHLELIWPSAEHPRLLSEAEESELWLEVVSAAPGEEISLEPAAAARAARRARRAMVEHGIPLEALAAHASEEARALLEWCTRFDARCRSLGCIAPDRLWPGEPWMPAAALEGRIAWIESLSWTPAARRWLEMQAGAALAAARAGRCERPAVAHRFDSPARELAAIAAWARRRHDADPEFRAWICIPDLALRRAAVEDAFDAELEPGRFSLEAPPERAPRFALAGGPPLAEHGPVRAALELLVASHGALSFERFSALLREPAIQADPTDTAAARLDLELRRVALAEAPLATWLARAEGCSHAGATLALARLRAARRALALAGSGRSTMSGWVAVWMSAFEAAPWASRARWSSTEYQAAARFRELLASLSVAERTFGRLTRSAAEGILRRAARATPFQAQTGVAPIWVSAQRHDPWLAYDAIWVSGCEEQRWPPPSTPLPLLPVPLQRTYGILAAEAARQLAHAEELQRRWRARAAELHFSGADSGEGRSGRLSALLGALCAPASGGAGIEPEPEPEILPSPLWHAQRRAAPPLEIFHEGPGPAFGAGERTRGVATLQAQSRCAFRGFALTRLEVEALRRPAPGFNEAERGMLVHDALERLWRELGSSAALEALAPPARARLIATAVAAALERRCKQRDPGVRWREREQSRLEALLERWLEIERLRLPFRVERLEGEAPTLRLGGLDYEVRIDRVDRLEEDDAQVLIDYKSGSVGCDWRGERPDNPQLPLYALTLPGALAGVAYARINASDCRFYAETDRKALFKPRTNPTQLEGAASLGELKLLWARRLERLARDVAAGRAVLDPTPTACASCDFAGLCRVDAAAIERADE